MQTDPNDDSYLQPFQTQRRSKLGLASLVLSILGIGGIVGMISTIAYLKLTTEEGFDKESTLGTVMGLCIVASMGAMFVAVVSGLAGLFRKGVDRTAAGIGFGLGIVGLAIVAGLALFGSGRLEP